MIVNVTPRVANRDRFSDNTFTVIVTADYLPPKEAIKSDPFWEGLDIYEENGVTVAYREGVNRLWVKDHPDVDDMYRYVNGRQTDESDDYVRQWGQYVDPLLLLGPKEYDTMELVGVYAAEKLLAYYFRDGHLVRVVKVNLARK